mgnify:CR=1 FL=1
MGVKEVKEIEVKEPTQFFTIKQKFETTDKKGNIKIYLPGDSFEHNNEVVINHLKSINVI